MEGDKPAEKKKMILMQTLPERKKKSTMAATIQEVLAKGRL